MSCIEEFTKTQKKKIVNEEEEIEPLTRKSASERTCRYLKGYITAPLIRGAMAEYSQVGILTAMLLFTVVTVRDIYIGKNMAQQQHQQAADNMDIGHSLDLQKPGKHKLYTGPVLKFQYCIS
ncbi:hypothetical protein GJAV_G00201660 [Gymnothorax javanicus]|nr:hypothetical protein GJAV_G00201660 [Gymnothorax javanicus]